VTWVVAGGVGALVLLLANALVMRGDESQLHGSLVWGLAGIALPAGIAVAVLRSGLYELDSVLSRTVSYALVTGLLLAVYSVIVTLVPNLLHTSDSLAVAAATLAAAALARPALRRIQAGIDRQYNRTRYDADRAVHTFGNALRNVVDPSEVLEDLRRVVQTTVEPTRVGVWVRDAS
jgi:hypothetical protein